MTMMSCMQITLAIMMAQGMEADSIKIKGMEIDSVKIRVIKEDSIKIEDGEADSTKVLVIHNFPLK